MLFYFSPFPRVGQSVKTSISSFVVAGTHSGVGKTSVSLAIASALRARGLTIRMFKSGPDFLDPTWHAAVSGRKSYNLDGWMMGAEYVKKLFQRASAGTDVALVEGAMGLYDSSAPGSLEGSAAEISFLTGAPVALVMDARGIAGSIAAAAQGYCNFAPGLRVAGIIVNNTGSPRHAEILSRAFAAASLPPLLGAIPRGAFPALPGRHLGLVTAADGMFSEEIKGNFAAAAEKHIDLGALLRSTSIEITPAEAPAPSRTETPSARIGVARDAAFHFYYHDNLEALESAGAELVFFSPLSGDRFPDGLDGLYLGGGYPEEFALRLSANGAALEGVRKMVRENRPVYAECGGLMYLSRGIETLDGSRYPLAGVLPFWTRMHSRFKALGYVEASLLDDTLLGKKGDVLRGHVFHYSGAIEDEKDAKWDGAYEINKWNAPAGEKEGYARGAVLASYVHAHLASRPEMARHFVGLCAEKHNRG